MSETRIESGQRLRISARALAASMSGTAKRAISQPAASICWICSTVFPTSRVSVLVIDCTTMGASPPIVSRPTWTARVLRRGGKYSVSLKFIPQPRSVRPDGPHDVVIHNEHRQQQQEDDPGLHKPLFYFHTQVVADQTLDEQHQEHSTIQDRNGEQVEDTQLETDESDQHHELRKSRPVRFA